MNPDPNASAGAGGIGKERSRRAGFSDASPNLDRLPPHSPEAEQGVLGCVLLSPNDCLGQCVEHLGDAKVFYDLRHQTIYDTLIEMHNQRVPIDIITLQERLKQIERLEEVGGRLYINSLPDTVPSAANLSYYLEIVQEKAVLRRLLQTCAETTERVYEHDGDVDSFLDTVEREVLGIRLRSKGPAWFSPVELLPQAVQSIEDYHAAQGKLMGVGTGLADVDRLTGGLKAGELVVVAARPSVGKTSLAMQIAEHAAVEAKMPVGVFSLEMSPKSLFIRSLCSCARVDYRSMTAGCLVEGDCGKLARAGEKLKRAPLYIEDVAGITIMELRSRARRLMQAKGVRLVVVDYLQLLKAHSSRGRRLDNREQEVAEISSGLKHLAMELDIPVLALAQLNREMERKNRKPVLADLRESGAIEQDADQVWLLYKVEADEPPTEDQGVPTNLCVAKHRNGPTGQVNLMFLPQYTRFEMVAKISAADVP